MNPVLIRPRSVGRLTLRSARVADPPRLDPNYFDHPDDMKAMIEGVRLVSGFQSHIRSAGVYERN